MPVSAKRLYVAAFALAAVLVVGPGCAGGDRAEAREQFRTSFRRVFQSYQRFEPAKSLALAHDGEGRWAYGFARGQEGEMQAITAAEEQCRRRRARYGVQAPCRTYALGDEILGDPALVRRLPAE